VGGGGGYDESIIKGISNYFSPFFNLQPTCCGLPLGHVRCSLSPRNLIHEQRRFREEGKSPPGQDHEGLRTEGRRGAKKGRQSHLLTIYSTFFLLIFNDSLHWRFMPLHHAFSWHLVCIA
ncbi:MAG: hypothetical protein ACK55I_51215, partial [bacterium]